MAPLHSAHSPRLPSAAMVYPGLVCHGVHLVLAIPYTWKALNLANHGRLLRIYTICLHSPWLRRSSSLSLLALLATSQSAASLLVSPKLTYSPKRSLWSPFSLTAHSGLVSLGSLPGLASCLCPDPVFRFAQSSSLRLDLLGARLIVVFDSAQPPLSSSSLLSSLRGPLGGPCMRAPSSTPPSASGRLFGYIHILDAPRCQRLARSHSSTFTALPA